MSVAKSMFIVGVERGMLVYDFCFGDVFLQVVWDPCEVLDGDELVAPSGDGSVSSRWHSWGSWSW